MTHQLWGQVLWVGGWGSQRFLGKRQEEGRELEVLIETSSRLKLFWGVCPGAPKDPPACSWSV